MQQIGEIKQSIIDSIGRAKDIIGEQNAKALMSQIEEVKNVSTLFRMHQELREVIADLYLEMGKDAKLDTSFNVSFPEKGTVKFNTYSEFQEYVDKNYQ